MMHYNLHIDECVNQSPISISYIKTLGAVRSFLKKLMTIKSFKSGLVARINKRLDKQYLILQGYIHHFEHNPEEISSIPSRKMQDILNSVNETYFALESARFFDNDYTKSVSESAVNAAYELERVYWQSSNGGPKIDDKELFKYTNDWSKAKYSEFING